MTAPGVRYWHWRRGERKQTGSAYPTAPGRDALERSRGAPFTGAAVVAVKRPLGVTGSSGNGSDRRNEFSGTGCELISGTTCAMLAAGPPGHRPEFLTIFA